MNSFIFKGPTYIHYGINSSLELADICQEYDTSSVMFVTGSHLPSTVEFKNILNTFQQHGISYSIFSGIHNEPTVSEIDYATSILKQAKSSIIIAIGGGSILDSAKAMAILANNPGSASDYMYGGNGVITAPALPLICVPTTAGSGSEVTASSVILDEIQQVKLSITHNYLFPKHAVIDPMLQCSMPHMVTISTGMDALTHAIEAYTSTRASLLSDVYALKAIEIIGSSIEKAAIEPHNIDVRSSMAIGSTLAALAFVNGGLGAVHGISQSMGGIAHVPHGIGNAILLPYVMEVNYLGNPEKFANIAKALKLSGSSTEELAYKSVNKIKEISRIIGIPVSTKEIGINPDMFNTIIKETIAYRLLPCNPVNMTPDIISSILHKSYEGK